MIGAGSGSGGANSQQRKDSWDKAQIFFNALAGLVIPVVIFAAGHSINAALEENKSAHQEALKESETSVKMIEIATNVLREAPTETPALREWAVDVLVHYSKVPLSPEAQAELRNEPFTPNTKQISIPAFRAECQTMTNNRCRDRVTIMVATTSVLKAKYSVDATMCASVRIRIFVDGEERHVSGFLGWLGATGDFQKLPLETGLIDLGPVPRGNYKVDLEAEAQPSGCFENGKLPGWGGSVLFVVTED